MKNLKSIGLSLTLITLLSTATFAGETPSPPYVCGPPCSAGETNCPPCATQTVTDEPTAIGDSQPVLPEVGVTDITEAVMWALSLF